MNLDRGVQPVRSGPQLALLAGFGGLIALMAFMGIDSIGVLGQVQSRNIEIRQKFLLRNRALEQIRSAVYFSGTFTRDYLLEHDPGRADADRVRLQQIRSDLDHAIGTYTRSLQSGEGSAFQALRQEIDRYWSVLDPILHWDPRQRQLNGDAFLRRELFPRRENTLQITDKIGDMNDQELSAGDEQLEGIFDRFRNRMTGLLVFTLAVSLALAAVTVRHILRLATDADVRFRQIARAQNELKELSARLVDAQEQERRSISRELHDEVGQSLSALLMELRNVSAVAPGGNTELVQHLDAIRQLAEGSVSVVRNMSLLLRPSMLDDLGLVPALQWQAREISKRTGMGVDVLANGVADDLPEEHRTCIYRVVQEALHNCSRHARARNVRIEVLQQSERILLKVQDDGQGFDSSQVRGMGLLGMEERVSHLGGDFQIRSEPGRGTALRIELPLSGRAVGAAG